MTETIHAVCWNKIFASFANPDFATLASLEQGQAAFLDLVEVPGVGLVFHYLIFSPACYDHRLNWKGLPEMEELAKKNHLWKWLSENHKELSTKYNGQWRA